jgi:Arc/MetJ-type ribon-helix-helix transcriptional regulator
MEATRRLEIELPEELADWMRAQIESGRFESDSEAAASALTLMLEQDEEAASDPEMEDWLRNHVVPTYRAWQASGKPGLTVDEVRASLARRRAERQRHHAAE